MALELVKLQDYGVEGPKHLDLTAIPMPKLGGKCWLLDAKGQFVLERGAGTLRTIACTGAGSGTLVAIDGVPDENGEIPLEHGSWRLLFKANPVVMGSWMLDAGFNNGLTLRNTGGQAANSCMASVVWVPFVRRK